MGRGELAEGGRGEGVEKEKDRVEGLSFSLWQGVDSDLVCCFCCCFRLWKPEERGGEGRREVGIFLGGERGEGGGSGSWYLVVV